MKNTKLQIFLFIIVILSKSIIVSADVSTCNLLFATSPRIEKWVVAVSEENWYDIEIPGIKSRFPGAIRPNETEPINAKPIWNQAPKGIYVSVGTERGFIGAAMSKATHLILADMGILAVKYNFINTVLLRIAHDQNDYLQLRFASDQKIWANRVTNLEPDVRALLESKATFDFWHGKVNSYNLSIKFENFSGANYLVDKKLFSHVHRLAREGRINVLRADFNLTSDVDRIVTLVGSLSVPIGAIDISNAWHPDYMELPNLRYLLSSLKPYSSDNALLVATDASSTRQISGDWVYFGYTLSFITAEGRLEKLIRLLADTDSKKPITFPDDKFNGSINFWP